MAKKAKKQPKQSRPPQADKEAVGSNTAAPKRVLTDDVNAKPPELNTVHCGDCIKLLERVPRGSVNLVFADPPFNIGYHYDRYDDRLEYDEYVAWSREWMQACKNVLSRAGSFYVAIGDEFAAEIRTIGRELGLHLRSWIIWHYTFGQQAKRKFARAHVHIFYFTKNSGQFTFNVSEISLPSARHTEYSDRRANPNGRLPDDVWDEFPRVCGTFKERQGWHGCQMPESLLARIIRASSNPGDLVLDPFSGSGTTVVTAAKLGRRFLAFDVSQDYIAQAKKRLEEVSAATHRNGSPWSSLDIDTLCSMYRETNTALFRLLPNQVAMDCFTRLFNVRTHRNGNPLSVNEVSTMLEQLDRQSTLPRLRNDRNYTTPSRRQSETPTASGGPDAANKTTTHHDGAPSRRPRRNGATAPTDLLWDE